MPEIKISELTSASTPAGTEVLAIVQSGDTKKTTINSLASALEDNLSTGAPTWTTAGVLTAGHDIIAGGNDDGRVALTINDGYGNANITFNHASGIPDKSGSSARITSSVDSTQELLDFQLKSSVTSGTPTTLTSVLKLYEDSIQLLKPTTLSTSGTGTTSLVNRGYIDTALSGKADTSHTHSQYSLNTHLHDDIYSQIGHGHSIGNISNLQTILNGKIGETEINTSHFTFANDTLSLKTIQEGQIASGAVTNTKILDGAVSPSKLSTGAPSWSEAGRLTVDGEIRVGEDTGDGVAYNYIKGSRVGTLDTLILEGNDVIDIKTDAGTYDSSIQIFGNNHPTVPNQIYHKADYHIFQNKEGGEVAQIPPTPTPTQGNHLVRKDYVDSVINSSAITGLLSTPLSTNYPSYYIQGTVISGSLTGVWSGIGTKFAFETIIVSLKNLNTNTVVVSSFYTLTEDVATDSSFSVTKTFTRDDNYTIPSNGLYQLVVDVAGSTGGNSRLITTSGATATPPL